MSNNTNPNESAPAWGERNFESCKIEALQDGTYQVVNFTKTKVFFTGTYEACYTWILENHQGFSRSVLTKPAPKTSEVTMSKQTAVGFLIKEFNDILGPLDTKPMQDLLIMDAVKRAKQMQKEQILQAHIAGQPFASCQSEKAEQYYNETYGGQDESK
jgi:hypothetical protein